MTQNLVNPCTRPWKIQLVEKNVAQMDNFLISKSRRNKLISHLSLWSMKISTPYHDFHCALQASHLFVVVSVKKFFENYENCHHLDLF